MKLFLSRVLLGLGLALTTSCRGAIYSHTTEPLDINYIRTPVMNDVSRGDIKKITYSSFEVEFGKNGAGGIAKNAGFDDIYYIDIETLRILGFWTEEWVHVYGIPAKNIEELIPTGEALAGSEEVTATPRLEP
ncbi:MAG: hypothetical protein ACI841_000978 [Planctomycetota bacterium]|jgi:hypothetical protein